MKCNIKTAAVIGLGAIGIPLAHLLYEKIGEDFFLLSDEKHAVKLRSNTIYINGKEFSPCIVTDKNQIQKKLDIVFVCVKNYSIESAADVLKKIIDEDTIILPLQNGVYSHHYFLENFPKNVVLQGFAQGPNTKSLENNFVYQTAGVYHLGSSVLKWKELVKLICNFLSIAGIDCINEHDIVHSVWRKLMLNVTGNALTALTGIDYCLFNKSEDMQILCKKVMWEFQKVAERENIKITEEDIDATLHYFNSYNISKHTSMLDDVLNMRKTENEFIAGFIVSLAEKNSIKIPYIEMLYRLIKIKENVYLRNYK